MRSSLLKVGLLVAAAMLPVGAAEVNHSWEQLTQVIKPGKKVVVTPMKGGKVEGKLLALTEESITVGVGPSDGPIELLKADVLRVRYANIRMRHTLFGMAIGAGAGALLVGLASRSAGAGNSGAGALGGAIVFLGPGAAVGGAMPIGPPLYEAAGGLKKK